MLSHFLVSSSLKMKPANYNEKLINLDQHTQHHIQEYRNRYNHRLGNLYRILFFICISCTYWLTLYFNLLNRGFNLHHSRIERNRRVAVSTSAGVHRHERKETMFFPKSILLCVTIYSLSSTEDNLFLWVWVIFQLRPVTVPLFYLLSWYPFTP